jgi:hypothetical protein
MSFEMEFQGKKALCSLEGIVANFFHRLRLVAINPIFCAVFVCLVTKSTVDACNGWQMYAQISWCA